MTKLPDIPLQSWLQDQLEQFDTSTKGLLEATRFQTAATEFDSTEIPPDFPYTGGEDTLAEQEELNRQEEERLRQEELLRQQQEAQRQQEEMLQQQEVERQRQEAEALQRATHEATQYGISDPQSVYDDFMGNSRRPLPGTPDDVSSATLSNPDYDHLVTDSDPLMSDNMDPMADTSVPDDPSRVQSGEDFTAYASGLWDKLAANMAPQEPLIEGEVPGTSLVDDIAGSNVVKDLQSLGDTWSESRRQSQAMQQARADRYLSGELTPSQQDAESTFGPRSVHTPDYIPVPGEDEAGEQSRKATAQALGTPVKIVGGAVDIALSDPKQEVKHDPYNFLSGLGIEGGVTTGQAIANVAPVKWLQAPQWLDVARQLVEAPADTAIGLSIIGALSPLLKSRTGQQLALTMIGGIVGAADSLMNKRDLTGDEYGTGDLAAETAIGATAGFRSRSTIPGALRLLKDIANSPTTKSALHYMDELATKVGSDVIEQMRSKYPAVAEAVAEGVEPTVPKGWSEIPAYGTAERMAREMVEPRAAIGQNVGIGTGALAGYESTDDNDTLMDRAAKVASGALVGRMTGRMVATEGTIAAGKFLDSLISRGRISPNVLETHPPTVDRIRTLLALAARDKHDEDIVDLPGMARYLARSSPDVREEAPELFKPNLTAGEVRQMTRDPGVLERVWNTTTEFMADAITGMRNSQARQAETAADTATVVGLPQRFILAAARAMHTPDTAPDLGWSPMGPMHRVTDESVQPFLKSIADDMGMPTPVLYITPSPQVNASAARVGKGSNRKTALMITQGTIDAGFTEDEVRALLQHELAHMAEPKPADARHVVPPSVVDQMTGIPVAKLEPRIIKAIKARGGSYDPETGVTQGVTRAQNRTGAGRIATRGGPFYEPVPEGTTSQYYHKPGSYGAGANKLGGDELVPRTITRYRNPLIMERKSHEGEYTGAYDDAFRKLDIREPELYNIERQGSGDYQVIVVENVLKEDADAFVAQHTGPYNIVQSPESTGYLTRIRLRQQLQEIQQDYKEGTPERQKALEDLVAKYGGKPELIAEQLRIRPDQAESEYTIVENIIGTNGRRRGHDAAFLMEPGAIDYDAVYKHPEYVAANEAYSAAHLAREDWEADFITKNGGDYNNYINNPEWKALKEAEAQASMKYDKITNDLSSHPDFDIPQFTEVMGIREDRNPVPAPIKPEVIQKKNELQTLFNDVRDKEHAAYSAQQQILRRVGVAGSKTPEQEAAIAEYGTVSTELNKLTEERIRLERELSNAGDATDIENTMGRSGYSIHPDIELPEGVQRRTFDEPVNVREVTPEMVVAARKEYEDAQKDPLLNNYVGNMDPERPAYDAARERLANAASNLSRLEKGIHPDTIVEGDLMYQREIAQNATAKAEQLRDDYYKVDVSNLDGPRNDPNWLESSKAEDAMHAAEAKAEAEWNKLEQLRDTFRYQQSEKASGAEWKPFPGSDDIPPREKLVDPHIPGYTPGESHKGKWEVFDEGSGDTYAVYDSQYEAQKHAADSPTIAAEQISQDSWKPTVNGQQLAGGFAGGIAGEEGAEDDEDKPLATLGGVILGSIIGPKQVNQVFKNNPALLQTPGVKMFKSPEPTAKLTNPRFFESVFNFVSEKMTDSYSRLAQYQNDVAREYLRQTGGLIPARSLAAELKRLDGNRSAEMMVNTELKPALNTFRDLGIPEEKINEQLQYYQNVGIARHQGNYASTGMMADRDFPGGVTAGESQQYIHDFEEALRKSNPKQYQQYQTALKQVWDFGDSLLKLKRDSGLVSEQTYKDLRAIYPHYVPTHILTHMSDDAYVQAGRSLSVQSNTIHALTKAGTTEASAGPLSALIGDAYQSHAAANKNKVFNAFMDLWMHSMTLDPYLTSHRSLPGTRHGSERVHELANLIQIRSAKLGTDSKDWIPVTGFIDGTKVKIAVHKDLGDVTHFDSPVSLPIISGLTSAFRAGATARNPVFLTANAMLDFFNYMQRETGRDNGNFVTPLFNYAHALTSTLLDPRVWGDIYRSEYRGDALKLLEQGGGNAGHTQLGSKIGNGWLARVDLTAENARRAAQGLPPLSDTMSDRFMDHLRGILHQSGWRPESALDAEVRRLNQQSSVPTGAGAITGGVAGGIEAQRTEDSNAPVTDRLLRTGAHVGAGMIAGGSVVGLIRGDSPKRILDILKDTITLRPIEAIGERIELTPRVAAMRNAESRFRRPIADLRKQTYGPTTDLIDMMDRQATESTNAARTTTLDFAKGGSWSKTINQIIPFFNVGIQSAVDVPRAVAENPVSYTTTALATSILPMVAAEVWNNLEDQRAKDYDDVPQYLKDQGLVLMLPEHSHPAITDENGNRHPQFVHIRYRQLAPIAVLTREFMQRGLGMDSRRPVSERRDMFDAFMGAGSQILPVSANNQADAFLSLTPPVLDTGIQASMNRDTFRDRAVISKSADERASPLSQLLAQRLGFGEDQKHASWWEFVTRSMGSGYAGTWHGASEALYPPQAPFERAPSPQNEPLIGGLRGRVIKGTTGDRVERAREQVTSPAVIQMLESQGVKWRPAPVDNKIRNVPLTQQEYAGYQASVNAVTTQVIREVIADPEFKKAKPADKEYILERAVGSSKAFLANNYLESIKMTEAEAERRLKREDAKGHLRTLD